MEIGIEFKIYNHRLRSGRIDLGHKTIASFCKEYEINYAYYVSLETMKNFPSFAFGAKIAEIMNKDIDYLFPDF